jgi:hypothetical protein
MSTPGESQFVFINESVLNSAKSRYETDKANHRFGISSVVNDFFQFLTKPSSGRRGYLLVLFGRMEAPDIIHYSDYYDIVIRIPFSNLEYAYFLNLLGLDSQSYYGLWRRGGFLFLIGEEPENLKRERLSNELQSNASSFYPNDHMVLRFKLGVPLTEISLPKNLSNFERDKLMSLFLAYQLKIANQYTLVKILNTKEKTHRDKMQECYDVCEVERRNLFSSLENLGWSWPVLNNQVNDTRYKEWSLENGEWNIHKVDATFTRPAQINEEMYEDRAVKSIVTIPKEKKIVKKQLGEIPNKSTAKKGRTVSANKKASRKKVSKAVKKTKPKAKRSK